MSITSSIAEMSAITARNNAQYAAMRANDSILSMSNSRAKAADLAKKENALQLEKIKQETKAKAAAAQLKKEKSKKHLLDYEA